MNINQHNYEDFFLLYVDGELSAADKQTVEQFVQANPGLADELEMLQQLRLPSATILFEDKDTLYRNALTGISADNYEEPFLLYVDNELDADAKEQVETFVLQHPGLQEAFTGLKQTKLAAEKIPFPGKKSLYRKEEKEKPVFYMRWQQLMVAAAFIGAAVLVWTLFSDNSATTDPTFFQQKTSPNALREQKAVTASNNTGNPVNATETEAGKTNSSAAMPLLKVKTNRTGQKNIPADNNIAASEKNLITRNTVQPETAIPKTDMAITDKTYTEPQSSLLPSSPASLAVADRVETKNHIADIAQTNTIVGPAVYKELDTEDDKKSLYLGSIEINKDKLRGFFRKATSLFRGKAREQEEDKIEATPSSSSNTRSLK